MFPLYSPTVLDGGAAQLDGFGRRKDVLDSS